MHYVWRSLAVGSFLLASGVVFWQAAAAENENPVDQPNMDRAKKENRADTDDSADNPPLTTQQQTELLSEQTSQSIVDRISQRAKNLVRVTDAPYSIDWKVAQLCREPTPQELPLENPHRAHWIHVHVNALAEKPIQTGTGVYPPGSLIIKEKFAGTLPWAQPAPRNEANLQNAPASRKERLKTPELFTAMLKREPGYNPDCGDWEFLVIDGRATQVLARGKIESCMDCHKDYKGTDYVTRAYLPAVTENKPPQ
ncbi:MAG: cytochrome P460 family protein [Pirellulales bacterium]|nr:cytochrome P460 family protein [Pirellulales bacterium]